MLDEEDFKNEAFKDQTMKIHTEVSLAISTRLKNQEAWHHGKTDDQHFFIKERCREGLAALDCLDILLEHGGFEAYLEQHAILWRLLEELDLVLLIRKKIAQKFGKNCFFIAGLESSS